MRWVYVGKEDDPNCVCVMGVAFSRGLPVEISDEKIEKRLRHSRLFEEAAPVKRPRGRPRKTPKVEVAADVEVVSS